MDAQAMRDANKAKAHRLAGATDRKVDSSDWKPCEPMNNGVKTGMRPVSKQAAYRDGGKVIGEDMAAHRPRKDGGKAMTPDNYQNRDAKEANESREGKKFDGGMKNGGRAAHKDGGKVKDAKTNINIVIAPAGGQAAPPPAGLAPPMPMPMKPPMPPVAAPPAMGMAPQGMPPMMARKDGGKVYPLKDGSGGGLGRLAKAKAYGPEGFKGKLP